MIFGPDREGLHVDDGVLPDLGIDEPSKGQGEKALQGAGARESSISVDRGAKASGRGALHIAEIHAHPRFIPKAMNFGRPRHKSAGIGRMDVSHMTTRAR
ncbi:hypothetical protein DSM21852_20130 [Methylocystis bryophila]|nr:hypothetical protein DSM21852_20130 [Methylocystis bryophila]